MPKLLQINTTYGRGSVGKIANDIADVATTKGWECYFAHGNRYISGIPTNDLKFGSKFSDYFHYAVSLIFDCEGLSSTLQTRHLVKQIKELKPDIIHLQNIHGHYLNYKILFEYLATAGIPVVWTMHDCWPFTGHCTYFDMAGCDKWKKECGNCPNKKDYPTSLLLDRSYCNFVLKEKLFTSIKNLTMVPVSDWLGNCTSLSFLKNAKIHVIHNGIDLNKFKPTGSNLRSKYGLENKIVLLGVADVFGKRKGLDDFITLSNSLGSDYQIILIGASADEQARIPESIIAFNRTNSQKELIEFYSMADIFLNLTYEDNYPTTNLESIACGTPVITYRTGGSPEAVDELTGAVVKQGNIEELCNKILEFKNIGFKQIHSSDCRKRAEECFDKDKCFEKYIELYDKILETERGGVILCKSDIYIWGAAFSLNYGRVAA